MFIHTVLTESELRATMPRTGLDDVRLHILGTGRSRSHPNRFEVALRGVGARHTRAPQTHILDRSERERAATYDDWGWWLAEVFEMDETARCGNYRGRQEFEQVTRYTTPRRGRRAGSTLALGPRPIVLTARGRHVVRGLQTLGLAALLLAALMAPTLERTP